MTVLVGDDTQTTTINVGPNTYGDIEYCSYVAAATGSATDGYFYTTTTGFAFVVAVYDSAGTTLLGTSSEITSSTSGWNHVTFSSSVSITSGTTYILAILSGSDTSSGWQVGEGATSAVNWYYDNPSSAFFPTPPASLTQSGAGGLYTLSLYLTGSSGTAYTLTAAQGSFSLSGESATRGMAIAAEHNSFGLTGYTTSPGHGLTAATQSFALTGYAATLSWSGASRAGKHFGVRSPGFSFIRLGRAGP